MGVSCSVKETEELGYQFAQTLDGNETICLTGEVGSGKSSYVRGMIKCLFPDEQYKPPIRQTVCGYCGKLLHIDGSNFLKTGLPEEFLQFDGIRVVEHGNLWSNQLIFDYEVKITKATHREVEIWKQ